MTGKAVTRDEGKAGKQKAEGGEKTWRVMIVGRGFKPRREAGSRKQEAGSSLLFSDILPGGLDTAAKIPAWIARRPGGYSNRIDDPVKILHILPCILHSGVLFSVS